MQKQNKVIHHRNSVRLKDYDYSQNGAYNRICRFGNIIDGEMRLNECGEIAKQCWIEIPDYFPNAILHEHIIMPNHVHGIIPFL